MYQKTVCQFVPVFLVLCLVKSRDFPEQPELFSDGLYSDCSLILST